MHFRKSIEKSILRVLFLLLLLLSTDEDRARPDFMPNICILSRHPCIPLSCSDFEVRASLIVRSLEVRSFFQPIKLEDVRANEKNRMHSDNEQSQARRSQDHCLGNIFFAHHQGLTSTPNLRDWSPVTISFVFLGKYGLWYLHDVWICSLQLPTFYPFEPSDQCLRHLLWSLCHWGHTKLWGGRETSDS